MTPLFFPPGTYLARIKRPSVARARRQLLTDDALSWVLLAATARPASLRLGLGSLCLFAGFWALYELGYWDNDGCARHEAQPVVSPGFAQLPWHYPLQALAFTLLCSLAGLWLLAVSPWRWAAALLALAGCFALYNRLDKASRVYLYLGLQGFRALALLAVLPLGIAGLAAGLALSVSRWVGYCLYRLRPSGAWPDVPTRLLHLVLLLFLDAVLLAAPAGRGLTGWPALLLLLQAALLARRELAAACRRAGWLPARPAPPPAQA